jgi:hypothetical protein
MRLGHYPQTAECPAENLPSHWPQIAESAMHLDCRLNSTPVMIGSKIHCAQWDAVTLEDLAASILRYSS